MSTVLVEFCGLPGTGKTTLAGLTRRSLTDMGVSSSTVGSGVSAAAAKPVRVARRAAGVCAAGAMSPMDVARAAQLVARSGQPSTRDAAAVLAQWLATRRLLARARRVTGVHLAEEGLIQTLWTLGLRARRDVSSQLWAVTPETARPDLVVVVHAPLGVIADRLGSRASRHSRTQSLAPDAQMRELERGEALLDRLTRSSGIPLLVVPNDGAVCPKELAGGVAAHAVAVSREGVS